MTIIGEIEIIEHLDFDFEPPCEHTGRECSETAKWKLTWDCCGAIYLICDKHKELSENSMKFKHVLVICSKCNSYGYSDEREFSIVPLA